MRLIERALAHGGVEHAQAATETASNLPHLGHTIFFGLAMAIYFVLGLRLYYLEFKRTGRWQAPR